MVLSTPALDVHDARLLQVHSQRGVWHLLHRPSRSLNASYCCLHVSVFFTRVDVEDARRTARSLWSGLPTNWIPHIEASWQLTADEHEANWPCSSVSTVCWILVHCCCRNIPKPFQSIQVYVESSCHSKQGGAPRRISYALPRQATCFALPTNSFWPFLQSDRRLEAPPLPLFPLGYFVIVL